MWQAPGTEGPREIHRGRRYVVLRTWGQDGVARVIKQVRQGPLAAGSAAMLRHEYTLLRELRDSVPHIARAVLLEDEPPRLPVLTLEDSGPHDLQGWQHRRPVEVEVFMELALQAASILAALHHQHVIHRDINPTNLVMSADGRRLTLIDFDLATRVSGLAPSGGMPAELQWALPYIAPEQTGRMNRPLDHRADLYSLGATFYELLTGLPPFTSSDPVELVHAHLARPPVPLTFVNPAIPRVVSDIVLKLLAKMPEERYQSADSLLADLQEVRRRKAWSAPEDFELGRLDLARQLSLPERLYGREPQQAELRAARERVRRGASERVLLSGAAGIGKSALVHDLARDAAQGDRLLTGKFNQLQGNVPYSAFVQAFQGLAHELMEETPEARDVWRQRLLGALGPHARVITDVIPALEEILGPQPLPPSWARSSPPRASTSSSSPSCRRWPRHVTRSSCSWMTSSGRTLARSSSSRACAETPARCTSSSSSRGAPRSSGPSIPCRASCARSTKKEPSPRARSSWRPWTTAPSPRCARTPSAASPRTSPPWPGCCSGRPRAIPSSSRACCACCTAPAC